MKPSILVLSKRQYMAKDLLDDVYGRFYEIPLELAHLGHEVTGIALSYRRRSQGWHKSADKTSSRIRWFSQNLGPLILPGLKRHFRYLVRLIESHPPDLIWACSDSIHAIIAHRIHRRHGIPFVIDLYDNFESFGLTRLPGVLPRFRQACRAASGLTCVSQPLIERVSHEYRTDTALLLLENAIRSDLFCPLDKRECRAALGLPQDARIIGTAGALTRSRGIDDLFEAFRQLGREQPGLYLVLAGQRVGNRRFGFSRNIVDFGLLPLEKVQLLFNALDVAVICNKDSEFGRYCFPQKFYEIFACGTPLVAARVGAITHLLSRHPCCLYRPGQPKDLAGQLRSQLSTPVIPDLTIPSWKDQASKLSMYFESILRSHQQ